MFCGKSSRLHAIAKERGDTFRLYEGGPERHEISDEGAVLRCSRPEDRARLLAGTTLGRTLHHPALFAAYPELAHVRVRVAEAGSGFNANFSPRGITLSKATLDRGDTEALRSGLIHEIQHAVQLIEGDVEGSAPALMEKLVMREVIRPELDNVAKLLQGELSASELEFPTVKAFAQLLANPRLALKDRAVNTQLASAGFGEGEIKHLGDVCEAIFKLKGLCGVDHPLQAANREIRFDQAAAYQAKDGELEAHLTARRLEDPLDGRIPVAHSAANEMPLKWKLMWALDSLVFRIKMKASRAMETINSFASQSPLDDRSEAARQLRVPKIQVIGGAAQDRAIEVPGMGISQRGRPAADPMQNREIVQAIRFFRDMDAQGRQGTIAAAAAASESAIFAPPIKAPPVIERPTSRPRAHDLDMTA